jgi:hypothetical protein
MFELTNIINYFQKFSFTIFLSIINKFFRNNEPPKYIKDNFNTVIIIDNEFDDNNFDEKNGYGQFVYFGE